MSVRGGRFGGGSIPGRLGDRNVRDSRSIRGCFEGRSGVDQRWIRSRPAATSGSPPRHLGVIWGRIGVASRWIRGIQGSIRGRFVVDSGARGGGGHRSASRSWVGIVVHSMSRFAQPRRRRRGHGPPLLRLPTWPCPAPGSERERSHKSYRRDSPWSARGQRACEAGARRGTHSAARAAQIASPPCRRPFKGGGCACQSGWEPKDPVVGLRETWGCGGLGAH